jgi:predicted transcriptional regulator
MHIALFCRFNCIASNINIQLRFTDVFKCDINRVSPFQYLVAHKASQTNPEDLSRLSQYDLRKVYIPSVCEDGTSSYLPRSARKKADLLRKRLLTCAAQKKQATENPPLLKPRRAPLQGPPLSKPRQSSNSTARMTKGRGKKKTAEPCLPPSGPVDELAREEEEDPNMLAAQALLEAKERFKQQRLRAYLREKAAGIRAEAPEDLSNSDVQEELEDIIEDAQSLAYHRISVTETGQSSPLNGRLSWQVRVLIDKHHVHGKGVSVSVQDPLSTEDHELCHWYLETSLEVLAINQHG